VVYAFRSETGHENRMQMSMPRVSATFCAFVCQTPHDTFGGLTDNRSQILNDDRAILVQDVL
jgi:hypothetical protein